MSREPHPIRSGDDAHNPLLLDIGRTLMGALRAPDLYRSIYEQTSRVLDTAGLYVSVHDPAADEATIVLYADQGRLVRPGVTYRGSDCVAIRDGRAVLERIDGPDAALSVLLNGTDAPPRCRISAPMVVGDETLGAISVLGREKDALGEEDLAMLAVIADLAAVALDHARRLRDLDERCERAERMEALAARLTGSLDVDDVLDGVMSAARELLEPDNISIWLVEDGLAKVVRADGPDPQTVGTVVEVPAGFYDVAMRERAPLVFEEPRESDLIPPELKSLVRSASTMAAVLIRDDELVGVLGVGHAEPHRFSDREIRLIDRLATHATTAISNARLHARMRSLSLTDPLTQLANRRHMEIFLRKEFAAARRGRPLTVILFDLDDFKDYNDRAGHQAGDSALRTFGEILASQTRAMNLAARYGGDEFIAILSGTPEEGARVHLRRILDAFADDAVLAEIGVSAGVAAFRPEMETSRDLILAADRDLYACKRRHRVGR